MSSNPFSKFVIKEDDKGRFFHSSGYGKVQNEGIGAASTQSFEERMKMERNRQVVRGYKDSMLVNGARARVPRAEPAKKEVGQGAGLAKRGVGRDAGVTRRDAGLAKRFPRH